MSKTLIKGAKVVNEGQTALLDVLIQGERIAAVAANLTATPEMDVIDASGKFLLPGCIDDQVHFREPGLTHKATIESESRAALAGGITTFFEMPNTQPNTTTIDALNNKYDIASENSIANYSFMFGGTNSNLDEILEINTKEVPAIKLFLGSSTGNMLVDDLDSLENIFSNVNIPIAVHCEDEKTIKDNLKLHIERFGDNIPINYHPKIRSEEACFINSSMAVALAKKTGARLHVFHLSTAKELELFSNKIELKDKQITSEVCIHHLTFCDEDYDKFGSKIKWNPAIKSKDDRDALWEALKDNKIDIIASDHAPHTIEEKNNKYLNCPSGGPMVQHTILSLLQNCEKYGVSIEKIVEKIAHNPAIIFKVNKRGFLREGYYADIVLIDTNTPTLVTKETLLYKCGWSPFEGQKFDNSIHKTILNGNVVYEDGRVNSIPRGKKIIFNR